MKFAEKYAGMRMDVLLEGEGHHCVHDRWSVDVMLNPEGATSCTFFVHEMLLMFSSTSTHVYPNDVFSSVRLVR